MSSTGKSADVVLKSKSSTFRQLLRGMSVEEQFGVGDDDQVQTAESIKSMPASLAVKRKYR